MTSHETWLDIADKLATYSHCVSHKVGCVIVKNDSIVSSGINGTVSGYPNCDSLFPCYNPEIDREKHHEFSEKCEIHAEQNALAKMLINGISPKGCRIYTSLMPCNQCAKIICAIYAIYRNGVDDTVEIYYRNGYDLSDHDNAMLSACGVRMIKI